MGRRDCELAQVQSVAQPGTGVGSGNVGPGVELGLILYLSSCC